MWGTIVNSAAILGGALLGTLVKKGFSRKVRLTDKFNNILMQGIGLSVVIIGISNALKTQNMLLVIISLVIGGIIGQAVGVEKKLNSLGDYAQKKLGNGQNSIISEGFVTASLIYCVGAMAIVGSLDSGIEKRLYNPVCKIHAGWNYFYCFGIHFRYRRCFFRNCCICISGCYYFSLGSIIPLFIRCGCFGDDSCWRNTDIGDWAFHAGDQKIQYRQPAACYSDSTNLFFIGRNDWAAYANTVLTLFFPLVKLSFIFQAFYVAGQDNRMYFFKFKTANYPGRFKLPPDYQERECLQFKNWFQKKD